MDGILKKYLLKLTKYVKTMGGTEFSLEFSDDNHLWETDELRIETKDGYSTTIMSPFPLEILDENIKELLKDEIGYTDYGGRMEFNCLDDTITIYTNWRELETVDSEELYLDEDNEELMEFFSKIEDRYNNAFSVSFDGYGDDGSLQEMSVMTDNGMHSTTVTNIPAEIEDFCYHVLQQWDWVNNDGGYGDLYFSPRMKTMKLEINFREDVEKEEEEKTISLKD